MMHLRPWQLVAALSCSLCAIPASARSSDYIPVQGVLSDSAGRPLTAQVAVRFALYPAASGGAALWSETQQVLPDQGVFTAYLGQVQPLDLGLFRDNGDLWLGVTVGSDPEMPRVPLGSAPYSGFAKYCGVAPAHTHGMNDLPPGLLVGAKACPAGKVMTGVGAAGELVCEAAQQGQAGQSVVGTAELPGANCAAGGVKYDAASGVTYVCNGAPGATGQPGQSVASASEAPGVNCANGGVRYTSASGVSYVCNGAPGATGQPGQSVASASEAPGANCASGGVRYTSASGPSYVCNGAAGAPGLDGQSVTGVPEPAGANCPDGGVKYTSASGTHYVCNGSSGAAANSVTRTAGEPLAKGDAVSIGNGGDAGSLVISATQTAYDYFGSGTRLMAAQSFGGDGGLFKKLRFRGNKWNNPTFTVKVAVQGDAAGIPSGADIAAVTLQPADWPTATPQSAMAEKWVTFASTFTLAAGTTYWVVFTANGSDPTNYYLLGMDTTNSYAGGAAWIWQGGWTQSTGIDFTSELGAVTVAGQIYKTRAGVADLASTFLGFASTAATRGGAVQVQFAGVVSGFGSLAPGTTYFESDTAGAISAAPGIKKIGMALSLTDLLILQAPSPSFAACTWVNATSDNTTCSFACPPGKVVWNYRGGGVTTSVGYKRAWANNGWPTSWFFEDYLGSASGAATMATWGCQLAQTQGPPQFLCCPN